VALLARSTEQLEHTVATIRSAGASASAFSCDVDREQDIESAVVAVEHEIGEVDILVNAAGISPNYTRAEDLLAPAWDAIMTTNLRGTFLTCRSAGRRMLARRRGAIVNVSSIGATSGLPRLAAYAASKGGVEALTRTLAVEWADRGVRVNAIAPAFVKTEMTDGLLGHAGISATLLDKTPLGRFAEAGDISGAVVFLVSDAARYITGATLAIDGGWSAR
jgi:NAD(P)-dependent dehydrogenase (short-subunit alcohol dehydrogenase family)